MFLILYKALVRIYVGMYAGGNTVGRSFSEQVLFLLPLGGNINKHKTGVQKFSLYRKKKVFAMFKLPES